MSASARPFCSSQSNIHQVQRKASGSSGAKPLRQGILLEGMVWEKEERVSEESVAKGVSCSSDLKRTWALERASFGQCYTSALLHCNGCAERLK